MTHGGLKDLGGRRSLKKQKDAIKMEPF
jgi:hypothetical protein